MAPIDAMGAGRLLVVAFSAGLGGAMGLLETVTVFDPVGLPQHAAVLRAMIPG